MPLTVHVTADDIAKGVRGDCYDCPLARALRRQTGDHWWVEWWQVGRRYVKFGYTMSRRLDKFVEDFDRGYPVKPSSFTLRNR